MDDQYLRLFIQLLFDCKAIHSRPTTRRVQPAAVCVSSSVTLLPVAGSGIARWWGWRGVGGGKTWLVVGIRRRVVGGTYEWWGERQRGREGVFTNAPSKLQPPAAAEAIFSTAIRSAVSVDFRENSKLLARSVEWF